MLSRRVEMYGTSFSKHFCMFSFCWVLLLRDIESDLVPEEPFPVSLEILELLFNTIDSHRGCAVLWIESQNNTKTFLNSMAFLEKIHSNQTNTLYFLNTLSFWETEVMNLRRFSPSCQSVFTVIPDKRPEFTQHFQKFVTKYDKVNRKDEDYYVFVAPNKQVAHSFLESPIGFLVRYKIVIYPYENYDGLNEPMPASYSKFCIYCPDTASKIISQRFSRVTSFSLSQLFPDFTRNMNGYTVKISAPTKYLGTYQMHKVNGQWRHKRGIHTRIFNTISAKFNMSYTLQPCTKYGNVPEGATGVLMPDGKTWAGCMGDVVRNISDVGFSVSPDEKRYGAAVHFTSAFEYTSVTFITSKPGLYYSWTTIFTCLSNAVWIALFVSIVVASLVMHFMDRVLGLGQNHETNAGSTNKLIATFLYVTGNVVGQDLPTPESISSKCTYSFWLFYGILMGAVYSSSLQSQIVSPGQEIVPRTFAELAQSNYRWGASTAFRDGLGEQLFKHSSNPVMRALYHKMEGDKDEVICTAKALSDYACFNWDIMQRMHLVTEFADKSGSHPFQFATDVGYFTSIGYITRKREIYRSHFSDFMARSFDTGLVKQMTAKDWSLFRMKVVEAKRRGEMKELGERMVDEGPKPFKFENVKGSFFLLLCGLIIALLSVIAEITVGFRQGAK